MRRPSGFDREPEPRADQTSAADNWDAPAGDDVADVVPNEDGRDGGSATPTRAAWRMPALSWPRRRRDEPAGDSARAIGEGDIGDDHAAMTVDLSGIADDLAVAEGNPGAAGDDGAEGLAITTDLSAVRARAEAALATEATEAPEHGLRVAEQQLKAAIRGRKRRERREQRRFTWHVRQRRRPWLVAGAAVLAVALFVVIGVFTPLMSVRVVQVEGASRVDVAAVEAALAPLSGTPLALVDQAEVHRALVPFPLIQRYTIETIPPHTLVVRLEERIPVLAIPSDAGFDLVDPAGVTVEQSEARPEGVPLAEGVAATRSSVAFSEVARVLRDVPPELRAQFATATASTGQDVSFVLHSGVQVVWGEAEETPRKAVVLAAILGALGERPVSLIDVSSSEAPIFR